MQVIFSYPLQNLQLSSAHQWVATCGIVLVDWEDYNLTGNLIAVEGWIHLIFFL
jgi:hypothetical protein